MITIDDKKLEALKDLMVKTEGAATPAQVKALKIPEAQLEAYQEELGKRWPEIFGEDDGPEEEKPAAEVKPEPVAEPATVQKAQAKKQEPVAPKPFRYIDEHNHVHDLEVAKETASAVFLRRPVKTDKVTVLVKGQPVEIDLEVLRKADPNAVHPVHGIANSVLITLGEVAKG